MEAPRRRALAIALLLAALAGLLAAPLAQAGLTASLRERLAAAPDQAVPVVVTLHEQVDPSAYEGRPRALLRALRATAARTQPAVIAQAGVPARRLWITNALAMTLTPARARRLARLPAVASVDLDRTVSVGEAPVLSSPPAAEAAAATGAVQSVAQLPLDAIGARATWNRHSVRGQGVLVGSIDTGVDVSNPDLVGKVAGFRDFVNGRADPYDDHGHGSHAIGTMIGGSASGSPIGVAPEARVLVAKAMDAQGAGLGSALLAAAQWMADPDGNPATADAPAVVNNSWTGGDANDPWFRQVARVWRAVGIVPVFAAGNAGPGARTIGSPASYPETLSVAAVDDAGVLADFSSRGPVAWQNPDGAGPPAGTELSKADLAAPGVGIVSSAGSGYKANSGTSMASPHVAGVVALVKQAAPSLSVPQVIRLLLATARDLGPAGPDPGYGAGAVDALAAVSAALGAPATTVTTGAGQAPPPSAAPGAAPSAGSATAASPLRLVRARDRVLRAGKRLFLSGLLVRPARVRAGLVPLSVVARRAGRRPPAAAVTRPAGRFRFSVPLRAAAPGRYRLEVQAQTRAGRALGRPVRMRIRIVRGAVRRPPASRAASAPAVRPPGRGLAQRGRPDLPGQAGRADGRQLPPVPKPPGVGPVGPAVVPLTLANLVNGDDIDLSAALGESQLPADLGLLDLVRLDDRACRGVAVVCLGIDRPLLNKELRRLIKANQAGLALRNLGALNLPGVGAQVDANGKDDLTQLISVQRVDDRVLRLAPVGPLAELSGIPGIPDVVVGRFQAVGVQRCPPAEADGLPRVCVA